MLILGVRTSPTIVRYALLDWDGQSANLVNTNDENKLIFPADCQRIEQKLHWLYQEMERVLRQHPDVQQIVIKANEFGRGGESSTTRESAYLDAIIFMIAGQRSLPIDVKLYRSIGTRRDEVMTFAENNVGVTGRNWNVQMADAVAAAWFGRNN